MSTGQEPILINVGSERTSAIWQPAANPKAALALGHGASVGKDHATMERLAQIFCERGISVMRFNFLYMERKSGPPDRMPKLQECFAAVAERMRELAEADRILIGGHSMGGRAASMLASEGFPCSGAVLLSYPLHPSGQPEKLRFDHLKQIAVPVLCMNGTRDDLCDRALMESLLPQLPASFTMHWLEGADHGYHVLKRSGRTVPDVFNEISSTTAAWISRFVLASGPG
ncbi:MAG TPA: alpha/beta family hydrolase [Chthonomonadales bacterium]|nr:alpha/beta family hydrolase [Chthonomonadales bacterium]